MKYKDFKLGETYRVKNAPEYMDFIGARIVEIKGKYFVEGVYFDSRDVDSVRKYTMVRISRLIEVNYNAIQ